MENSAEKFFVETIEKFTQQSPETKHQILIDLAKNISDHELKNSAVLIGVSEFLLMQLRILYLKQVGLDASFPDSKFRYERRQSSLPQVQAFKLGDFWGHLESLQGLGVELARFQDKNLLTSVTGQDVADRKKVLERKVVDILAELISQLGRASSYQDYAGLGDYFTK